MIGAAASSMRVAQQSSVEQAVLPAPLGGMDARIGVSSEDMNVCLWAINMLPAEYGMRVRKGYREWQDSLPSEVRTVIPYDALDQTGGSDKIFAVSKEGIYDVTAVGGTPALKFTFAAQTINAGWGVFTHYIDAAGDDILFYADSENGLLTYTPATDTWAQATGITAAVGSLGPFDVTKVAYIVVHKLRIWLVEKDANKAWYLGVRASSGEATEFLFGAKFKHGGDLVGLYNWTVDGGDGRDDLLVAVSRGGDVMPYSGDDPSSDMTWENRGVFFIGRVPRGNRVASEYGGELYLLSTLGVISMQELVSGAEPEDPNRSQIGAKISRLIRLDMRDYKNLHGWNIKFVSEESALVVNTPLRSDETYRQYVLNLTTHGWGLWRDLPYVCGEVYDGDLLLGGPDGRVHRMDVNVDDFIPGGDGNDIKWFIFTSFSAMGAPALNKRMKFIRPNFSVVAEAPVFDVYARYDYLVQEPLAPTEGPGVIVGTAWDTALWDEDNWSSETRLPFFRAAGASGMGRTAAIAITGRSRGQTILASWDVMWDVGGFL